MKKIAVFLSLCSGIWVTGCIDSGQVIPDVPATTQNATQTTQQGANSNRSSTARTVTSSSLPATDGDCKTILIDGSRDGGVWWFPQYGNFDASQQHQGQGVERRLLELGFKVDVLSRNQRVTSDLLSKYSVVIRANAFETYTDDEVNAYREAVDRGITLALFSDHFNNPHTDKVAAMLGVTFAGTLDGSLTDLTSNSLTQNLEGSTYVAGSYITASEGVKLSSLARMGDKTVMALMDHPRSRVFLMGDTNILELTPALLDNLAKWMSDDCNH